MTHTTKPAAYPVITNDGSFLGYAHDEATAIHLGNKTDFTPSGAYLVNSGPAWEKGIKDTLFQNKPVHAWLVRE